MSPLAPRIVALVGDRCPAARTHRVARTLSAAIARAAGAAHVEEIDLAALGPRVLAADDPGVDGAVVQVMAADVLVVASPVRHATYTGALRAFLGRLPTSGLAGVTVVPVLVGDGLADGLAVDVHLTPLLLALGAAVPVRGLFVAAAELDAFDLGAAAWASAHVDRLVAPTVAALPALDR
jgi:FMN reductase